jgi:hypothetical protein
MPTQRIIFTVAGDVVLVLAVRHVSQRELQPDASIFRGTRCVMQLKRP